MMSKKRNKGIRLLRMILLLCVITVAGCGKPAADPLAAALPHSAETVPSFQNELTKETTLNEEKLKLTEISKADIEMKGITEKRKMILKINDVEVDVVWEENDAVTELLKQATEDAIKVDMNMYGRWEQVGSLGKNYTRNDKQITAECGDIMLYNGNQIVVFYGNNRWSYTRLGKLKLSDEETRKLLGNGNVTMTLMVKQ